jgi:hypothetical protein
VGNGVRAPQTLVPTSKAAKMFDLQEPEVGQHVVATGCRPGSATQRMSRLYHDCSTENLAKDWSIYPVELEGLITAILRGCKRQVNFSPQGNLFCGVPATPRPNEVIVGFSGGKDATAATLKLLARGKRPVLYYVGGINRAYPGERQACADIANALGLELIVQEVRVTGKQDWVENPIKNQYILALMVDYGARVGITEFCQGNLMCDTVETQAFGSGFSDSYEMFDACTPFFQKILPGYCYHQGLLKNDTDSLLTVYKYAPNLFPLIHSCMTPIRYHKPLRRRNNEKYGVTLMPHECGSCYKCCLKWLHFNRASENPAFTEHCYTILITSLERILGPGNYSAEIIDKHFIDRDLFEGNYYEL